MNILWTIIIGLIVGALAKLIMPGRDGGGILMTIVLGIAGALLAGWAGHAMGLFDRGQGPGIIASIIGAVVLLAIYRAVTHNRSRTLPV
ncbi:MAG: GlsB/YeaQ/YmgE family stress response membrane protein [Bacteroidota bacterium]